MYRFLQQEFNFVSETKKMQILPAHTSIFRIVNNSKKVVKRIEKELLILMKVSLRQNIYFKIVFFLHICFTYKSRCVYRNVFILQFVKN